jgi:hypothetical protein
MISEDDYIKIIMGSRWYRESYLPTEENSVAMYFANKAGILIPYDKVKRVTLMKDCWREGLINYFNLNQMPQINEVPEDLMQMQPNELSDIKYYYGESFSEENVKDEKNNFVEVIDGKIRWIMNMKYRAKFKIGISGSEYEIMVLFSYPGVNRYFVKKVVFREVGSNNFGYVPLKVSEDTDNTSYQFINLVKKLMFKEVDSSNFDYVPPKVSKDTENNGYQLKKFYSKVVEVMDETGLNYIGVINRIQSPYLKFQEYEYRMLCMMQEAGIIP